MNPLWIEGVGGHLICDTRVRRKWGGINYGVLRWKRVWFSFMPFQMSRWPRELTVFPLCFLFSASLNSSGDFSVIHHSRYVCPLPRRLFTQTPSWKSLFIPMYGDCNDFPPGDITVMVMMTIIWEMLRIQFFFQLAESNTRWPQPVRAQPPLLSPSLSPSLSLQKPFRWIEGGC